MDKEIVDALSGLGDRMSHLESIHPDITYTTNGLATNVVVNLPLILTVATLSAITVVLILKYKKAN